jgi:hypothetical protein
LNDYSRLQTMDGVGSRLSKVNGIYRTFIRGPDLSRISCRRAVFRVLKAANAGAQLIPEHAHRTAFFDSILVLARSILGTSSEPSLLAVIAGWGACASGIAFLRQYEHMIQTNHAEGYDTRDPEAVATQLERCTYPITANHKLGIPFQCNDWCKMARTCNHISPYFLTQNSLVW